MEDKQLINNRTDSEVDDVGRDLLMRFAVAIFLLGTAAHADDRPRVVFSKFETAATRAKVSSIACSLDTKATITVLGENACTSAEKDAAFHATVTTAVTGPARTAVVVELPVPEAATDDDVAQLREAARSIADEIERRLMPSYTLEDGKIIVEADGRRDEVIVDCSETHELVHRATDLYVACGSAGIAIYSLADPVHPVLSRRIEGRCVGLAADGNCALAPPAPPPKTEARSLALTVVGATFLVPGVGLLVVDLVLGVLLAIAPVFDCTSFFPSSYDPPCSRGGRDFTVVGVLAIAGLGGVALGGPLVLYGQGRVTVTPRVSFVPRISPTGAGGSISISF